jgi:muconolactone delta-isomerase
MKSAAGKEFRVQLHTSGKRYGKSYRQQVEMVARAMGAGAEKLVIEVVDYQALEAERARSEKLREKLNYIWGEQITGSWTELELFRLLKELDETLEEYSKSNGSVDENE